MKNNFLKLKKNKHYKFVLLDPDRMISLTISKPDKKKFFKSSTKNKTAAKTTHSSYGTYSRNLMMGHATLVSIQDALGSCETLRQMEADMIKDTEQGINKKIFCPHCEAEKIHDRFEILDL